MTQRFAAKSVKTYDLHHIGSHINEGSTRVTDPVWTSPAPHAPMYRNIANTMFTISVVRGLQHNLYDIEPR